MASRWESSSDEDEKEKKRLKKEQKGSEKSTRLERSAEKRIGYGSVKAGNGTIETPASSSSSSSSSVFPMSSQHPISRDANVIPSAVTSTAHCDIQTGDTLATSSVQLDEIPQHVPLFHGCRGVDSYQRLSFIDEGTYGMVFKARCRETGECFALKQVKMDGLLLSKEGFPTSALRETNILLALSHPNIVKVKEMVVGSTSDKIFMVMELGDADLRKCIEMSKQPFSTAEVKGLMQQFLSAVQHIHHNWYIHRDLKTTNLLYSNKGILSVCDFGMARKYDSPLKCYSQRVVSLWYRAPELLLAWEVENSAQQCVYGTPLDMWAVGCIFAEMLLRKPLFPGQGELDQISTIFKLLGAPNDDIWQGFSTLPHAKKVSWKAPSKSKLRDLLPATSFSGGPTLSQCGFDLLSRLLTYDPKVRISAKDAFEHPWFKESPLPTEAYNMPKFFASS